MKLKEIMSRDVRVCYLGDTLLKAGQVMWQHDFGCVPILDANGKVAGMLTDRDICMAAALTGRPLGELPVEGSMSKHVFGCAPDDNVEDAEAVMSEQQIRRVPIVDGGRIVGLVSMNDLVRAATSKRGHRGVRVDQVEATMAAICQPRNGLLS